MAEKKLLSSRIKRLKNFTCIKMLEEIKHLNVLDLKSGDRIPDGINVREIADVVKEVIDSSGEPSTAKIIYCL